MIEGLKTAEALRLELLQLGLHNGFVGAQLADFVAKGEAIVLGATSAELTPKESMRLGLAIRALERSFSPDGIPAFIAAASKEILSPSTS